MAEIIDRLSVADAAALLALPVEQRAQIMSLVRSAYFAGYDDAKQLAESDAESGIDWLAVEEVRLAGAGLWLTDHAFPLLDVDVGCEPPAVAATEPQADGDASRVLLSQAGTP